MSEENDNKKSKADCGSELESNSEMACDKCKCEDVCSILAGIQQQNTQILKKLDTVDELQKSIVHIKTQVMRHNDEIKVISNNVKNTVTNIEKAIVEICDESEIVQIEIRKMNLMMSGVTDDGNESEEDLRIKATLIVKTLTGKPIQFDICHRVGKHRPSLTRNIRIRFNKMSDRDLVWSNRMKSKPPIYINEDLPPVTRKAHAIMRNRLRELRAADPDNKPTVIWSQKTIKTESVTYQFHDGNIKMTHNPKPSTGGTRQ